MKELTQYDLDRLKKSAKNVSKILKEYSDLSYCRYMDYEVQQVVVKKGTKLYPYTFKEYDQKIRDLTKRYLFEIGVQKTILNGKPFEILFIGGDKE